MLTKKMILGVILTAAAVSSPMRVYADNGDMKNDWHHGPEHMMAEVLNLSADQEKQLKDSHLKQKEAMEALFEKMKANREAFNAEIIKAVPDMNKINDIQTQIKALQSQMDDNHLNALLEIRKILTPEQFAGYMALKKEKRMMKRLMMGHDQFVHKGGCSKDGDGHGHWGNKTGWDHGFEGQD